MQTGPISVDTDELSLIVQNFLKKYTDKEHDAFLKLCSLKKEGKLKSANTIYKRLNCVEQLRFNEYSKDVVTIINIKKSLEDRKRTELLFEYQNMADNIGSKNRKDVSSDPIDIESTIPILKKASLV